MCKPVLGRRVLCYAAGVCSQLNGTALNAPLSKYENLADLPALKLLNLSSTGLRGPLPERWFAGNVSAFPELLQLSLRNSEWSFFFPCFFTPSWCHQRVFGAVEPLLPCTVCGSLA